jgi:hypothetical protein
VDFSAGAAATQGQHRPTDGVDDYQQQQQLQTPVHSGRGFSFARRIRTADDGGEYIIISNRYGYEYYDDDPKNAIGAAL